MEVLCQFDKTCSRQCPHKNGHEPRFNCDLLEYCDVGSQACIAGRLSKCYPTEPVEKPEAKTVGLPCRKCKYRGSIPYNTHIRCTRVWEKNELADIPKFTAGPEQLQWFIWPINFDPIWGDKCDFFEPKLSINNTKWACSGCYAEPGKPHEKWCKEGET